MDALIDKYGEQKAREILAVNRHNTVVYPSFTLKGAITSIRVVKPVAVNKTVIESWVFRQVGGAGGTVPALHHVLQPDQFPCQPGRPGRLRSLPQAAVRPADAGRQ